MAFLNHVANQSNVICSQKNKKTVFPDHVIDALKVRYLNFELPDINWQTMNMQTYLAKIAMPKSTPKQLAAYMKQADKV